MYANILLSTDGSYVAKKGLEHGIALAKRLNAKVTVITVTEPLPSTSGGVDTPGDGFPHLKKLIVLTPLARNVRAKCSM
jgi:nucleotide-binding universal stress UspA family protein